MAIVQLEDLDGCIEVLVFPEAYQKYGVHVQQDAAVLVCGEVSRRDDEPKLIAQEIYPLADAPRYFCQQAGHPCPHRDDRGRQVEAIKETLSLHPGNTPVMICLQYPIGRESLYRCRCAAARDGGRRLDPHPAAPTGRGKRLRGRKQRALPPVSPPARAPRVAYSLTLFSIF